MRFGPGTRLLSRRALALAFALAPAITACGNQTLNAGYDVSRGALPVDERNPIILTNDGPGNWQGLYAILFSNTGGPPLAGIAINASTYATDLDANVAAWTELVSAARASGLNSVPDPTPSVGPPLVRPSSGNIEDTTPNDSDGAHLIMEVSARQNFPGRPVVIVAGGRLTDIADAYLLDPTVAERVFVIAALGTLSGKNGVMGAPNGELDPWADWIVLQHFRYVQVSAFYDGTVDLPSAALARLPKNPLCDLVAAQQPSITPTVTRTDQVSLLALAIPQFVVDIESVRQDPASVFDSRIGPTLLPSTGAGQTWLVTAVDPGVASARLQQMLEDPKTYGD